MNETDPLMRQLPNSESGNAGKSGPADFTPRAGTYILLFFLLIVYPLFGVAFLFFSDYDLDWDSIDVVYTVYLPTIIPLWLLFLAVALGLWREKSSFRSIGFTRFKNSHVFYAIGFLILANLVLYIMQIYLSMMGLTINQTVDEIVERAGQSVWWWGALSFTAAVCEEVGFRGYIMTRVKGLYEKGGWVVPSLLSAVAFGAGHSYQGAAGLILMFVYGLMFCGLFLYTRSIWPCILAHFIQDFSAIFVYRLFDS